MLDYRSATPEWLLGAIVGGLLTYLVQLMLQKHREKVKVILGLEVKPRTMQSLGAWAVVANLSSTPIWLQRLSFRAEELGMCGKPVTLDVGRTIDVGEEQRVECHESIYEAFKQITRGCDLHVGYVDITAKVQSNGDSAKPRRAYRLTSGRDAVHAALGAS
jgi:hypothetical protein